MHTRPFPVILRNAVTKDLLFALRFELLSPNFYLLLT